MSNRTWCLVFIDFAVVRLWLPKYDVDFVHATGKSSIASRLGARFFPRLMQFALHESVSHLKDLSLMHSLDPCASVGDFSRSPKQHPYSTEDTGMMTDEECHHRMVSHSSWLFLGHHPGSPQTLRSLVDSFYRHCGRSPKATKQTQDTVVVALYPPLSCLTTAPWGSYLSSTRR